MPRRSNAPVRPPLEEACRIVAAWFAVTPEEAELDVAGAEQMRDLMPPGFEPDDVAELCERASAVAVAMIGTDNPDAWLTQFALVCLLGGVLTERDA